VTPPLTITFLGGLGEIGRNCAAIESEGELLLLDCGLMFPDLDMPGVDLVLPDFTYLRERSDRIVGCIATHGHEDHVGGLSFLLRDLSFPIYGSAFTLGLARNRIAEAGLLDRTELIEVRDGERRKIGGFDVEFVPVTHSVPLGFATVIRTAQGVVLHSGDLKLDLTPVDGRLTDLARLGAVASGEGVRLYLGDSTNADEPGYSRSERSVGRVLENLFREHEGRRIVTTCFASHLHRIQQIAEVAIASGRKVATLGLSMKKNVRLALDLGVLDLPEDALVDIDAVAGLPPGQVCVISTGSQGEPMSALSLMASGSSKWLDVGSEDTVILSSHPIPGNEMNVSRVIDGLIRRGAEVVYSGIEDVHATGHAKQEELKTLFGILRPEWFVPVHGEYRHMVAHARLARVMGVADDRALVCVDGDQVTLDDEGLHHTGTVPADHLYVDGLLDDVGHALLRDRRTLADEGVVVVLATIDAARGQLLAGPQIITRGWVYAPEAEPLLAECADEVRAALLDALAGPAPREMEALQRIARKATGQFVSRRTGRRPMIVPVVVEI